MRLVRGAGFVLVAAAMLLVGAWCSVATWYGSGAAEPVRGMLAGVAAAVSLVAMAGLATRWRLPVLLAYSGVVALFLAWWGTISPTNHGNAGVGVRQGMRVQASAACSSRMRRTSSMA